MAWRRGSWTVDTVVSSICSSGALCSASLWSSVPGSTNVEMICEVRKLIPDLKEPRDAAISFGSRKLSINRLIITDEVLGIKVGNWVNNDTSEKYTNTFKKVVTIPLVKAYRRHVSGAREPTNLVLTPPYCMWNVRWWKGMSGWTTDHKC